MSNIKQKRHCSVRFDKLQQQQHRWRTELTESVIICNRNCSHYFQVGTTAKIASDIAMVAPSFCTILVSCNVPICHFNCCIVQTEQCILILSFYKAMVLDCPESLRTFYVCVCIKKKPHVLSVQCNTSISLLEPV